MSLTIDTLRADLAEATRKNALLTEELLRARDEQSDLARHIDAQGCEIGRLTDTVRRLQARANRAARLAQGAPAPPPAPVFADPEAGFRHAVLTAWATRIPAAEQPALPIPEYDIGPMFLASLAEVPDVPLDKVYDVAVEILTGLVRRVGGRYLHQLRSSDGSNAQPVRSAGATCWRAAIQAGTPQARRIHYWQLPGGRIEFSRVTLHDDFEP